MTDRRLMTALDLGFLILAAWLAANTAAGLLSARLAVPSAPPTAVRPTTGDGQAEDGGERAKSLSAYDAIARRNLFHTPDPSKTPPEPEPETPATDLAELEHTKMRLKLWGTVSGDKDRAYAVIEDEKKRKQNLYREGDSIQNAMVKRIMREQIVLTVDGKDEILAMEKKQAGASRIGQVRPSTPFPSNNAVTPEVGKRNIALKRDMIDDAMEDVNSLMQQAKIRPHFTDGEADGLTLSRVRRNSIFTKLGLRSGDIITGVDGEDIRSVDDALKFYNNLKNASNLSLQIKRRGRVETIEYNID